jgi:hypothetical protein
MPISPVLSTVARVALLVMVGLLAGSVFGVRAGYDFAQYSPEAYLEIHHGAVRGLNNLLPLLGLVAIVLSIGLAIARRANRRAMTGYLVAAALLAAAGLVTRFGNQPINDLVMTWSAGSLPADWEAVRDSWRNWHLVRMLLTLPAQVLLVVTALHDH